MIITSILIQLNCFENSMIRIGDGIRFALIAYNKLRNNEMIFDENILEERLYDMLTDLSTYTNKKSLDHFYEYISQYLIDKENIDIDASQFKKGVLSYYVHPEEFFMKKTKISLELFNYLYTEFLNIILGFAIDNFLEGSEEATTNYIDIPFSKYSKFYSYQKFKSNDDISARFLSDLDDFLTYNHIIKLKDFEIDENTLDLTLPILFDFSKIEDI